MTDRPLPALAALLALCLFGFFVFPGHTYLHQDSQIYLPMMERIADSSVLANDLIATHPHLSFTAYDEIAIGIKKLTGLDFQPILVAQQLLMRLLGLLGVFLLARGAGLGNTTAVLAAGLYAMGATIIGPSVLTVEYEPTPRTFALPLAIFALGLGATSQWNLAGAALFAGTLYHPPTVAPVATLMALFVLTPWHIQERWPLLRWLAASVVVLLILAKLQAGLRLEQHFFTRVSPDVEALQRMRAGYVFVGKWWGTYWLHYLLLTAVSLAAWWRVNPRFEEFGRYAFLALPILGLLSLVFSYISMDILGWSLMPQLQPARTLLWTTFAAVVGATLAAGVATGWLERTLWLLVPFAVIIETRPLELLSLAAWQHVALAIGLALLAALSLRLGAWAPALVTIAAMFLVLHVGRVRNYPQIHSPELDQLSAWAAANSPVDAVFHFPDAGKDLSPGIFRARARRAVWVDWKGGGQVNFMEPLAREWSRRWKALPAGQGQFLVRTAGRCSSQPLFSNARFCVEPTAR
jgi:hypothetical protein